MGAAGTWQPFYWANLYLRLHDRKIVPPANDNPPHWVRLIEFREVGIDMQASGYQTHWLGLDPRLDLSHSSRISATGWLAAHFRLKAQSLPSSYLIAVLLLLFNSLCASRQHTRITDRLSICLCSTKPSEASSCLDREHQQPHFDGTFTLKSLLPTLICVPATDRWS